MNLATTPVVFGIIAGVLLTFHVLIYGYTIYHYSVSASKTEEIRGISDSENWFMLAVSIIALVASIFVGGYFLLLIFVGRPDSYYRKEVLGSTKRYSKPVYKSKK